MAKVRFVVFHAGVDSLDTYRPLMEVGREALAVTNPGAEYVVLTDAETAPHLDDDFQVEALAPSGEPLMVQFIKAQLAYERKIQDGLSILAGTDCVAMRGLSKALKHPMAVTYRLRGRSRINNVAYVKDHELAAWFLDRSLGYMKPHLEEFFGDQQAWEDALGPFEDWELVDPEGKQDGLRVARPEGRAIHLYPCRAYNHFCKSTGILTETSRRAYIEHFKGPRKKLMVQSVRHYVLKDPDAKKPLKKSELARLKEQIRLEKRAK